MKVRLEDAGPCRKVLHVSVPPDAVAGDYGEIIKTFAKAVNIPGFRYGKAPLNVVEKHCMKDIEKEAEERLAPRFYREALREKDIQPVAVVDVRDMVFKKEDGLVFNVTIDVSPEFKLPKYKRISLKGNQVEVKDKDVEDALNRLLSSFARFEEVKDRTAKKDDLVQIDYEGSCDGKKIKELAGDAGDLGAGKDFWVLLGEPEFLPGFVSGLTGASIGENRNVEVVFPENYHVAALSGKKATYSVFVKAVRAKTIPRIDGDFLKKIEMESESALRERIRDDLVAEAKRNTIEQQKDEIGKFLIENTDFELPQSLVEQETRLMIRSILQRITAQGATEKQIGEQKGEILKAATRSSTERVKLSYILSRIADEEKINTSDGEVSERIKAMALQYRMTPERLTADLEKANGIERLKSDLRGEKTLDFLLENAKIKN